MDEVKMRDGYFAFYRWELEQGRWLLWPKSPWESVELHPDLWSAVPVFYHILSSVPLLLNVDLICTYVMSQACSADVWPNCDLRDMRGALPGLVRRASMAGLIQGLQSSVGTYFIKLKSLHCLFGVLASVGSGEAWQGSGWCCMADCVTPCTVWEPDAD